MRTFFKYLSVVLLLFSLLTIPKAFIYQDYLHKQLDKILHLKVRDTYKGGKKLATFRDAISDDNGIGTLTYALNPIYEGDSLVDLISFSIHEPVTEEDWGDDNIYWQFTYRFKELKNHSFEIPIINHYFGFTGKNGSTETLYPRAELVSFNKDYPWQFVVTVSGDGNKGVITDYTGEYSIEITKMIDYSEGAIIVRIPLNYEPLKDVFIQKESFHYVITGLWDRLSSGGFMPVKSKASLRSGGGASDRSTPKIYDYIPPKGFKQSNILLSSQLEPLIFNPQEVGVIQKSLDERIKDIRNLIDYDAINTTDIPKVESGNVEDNAITIAQHASLTAMKAGQSDSISQSMALVYEAYTLFDQALSLVGNIDDELHVLLNRGYVSQNVPESVFHKNSQGLKDFIRCAEIYSAMEIDKSMNIAECYLNAAICYINLGKTDDAQIYLDEALNILGSIL